MPTYWRLAELLKDRGITPGALAAKASLHRQSLYAILKNPRVHRIEGPTLDGLCDALNCDPGDLLVRDPPAPPARKKRR